MAKSAVFFTVTDPRDLEEAALLQYIDSRLTVIQVRPDGTCIAHLRMPKGDFRPGWFLYGPISICFISTDKNQKLLEGELVFQNIEGQTDEAPLVDATSRKLGFAFFTMALTAMDYRKLVDQFRTKDAIEILLSIHDFISLKEYRANTSEIKNHRIRNRILKSLILNTEQSFLLENGIEILNENEKASIESARPDFECSFSLRDGRQYSYKFEFGLTSDLGQRTAVLIGKNGSGKTQTLLNIARLALGSLTSDWRGNFTPSRVIGFYSSHRVSKVFPPQTLKRTLSGYKLYNITDEVGRSSTSAIDALLEIIGSDSRIADTTRFDILKQSIGQARKSYPISIFHEVHGPIEISKIHSSVAASGGVVFWTRAGDIFEETVSDFKEAIDRSQGIFGLAPNDLSSGEEAYVRFSIFSSAYTENGSLLLLDEPEVFLHPQFIDALMGSLQRVLELTGSVAVVATHSAYVVRCVQERMVYILRDGIDQNSDGRVHVQQTRMKTFGADVGLISLFVFGEDEMETTKNRAFNYLSRNNQTMSSLKSIISDDLFSKLENENEENK